MSTSRHERSEISSLHGFTGKNESSSLWKHEATPIIPPTRHSQSSNPFATIGTSVNIGKARQANGGNHKQVGRKSLPMKTNGVYGDDIRSSNVTKSRTVTSVTESRPPKRKKMEEAGPSQHAHPGAIDLSCEDDIGPPGSHFPAGQSTSSRFSFPPGSSRQSNIMGKKAPQLSLAKDGPDMQELNKRTDLEADPIESPTSTPPREREPLPVERQSRVRSMVAGIEQKQSERSDPPRKLDLRQRVKHKPPSRSNFGPANTFSPSAYGEAEYKSKKRKRKHTLPLMKYHISSTIESEAHVSWDGRALSILNADGKIAFTNDNFDECLCTAPNPSEPRMLIRLKFLTATSTVPSVLILLFSCEHPDWDFQLYEALLNWLKQKCSSYGYARVGHSIIDSILEEVEQEAEENDRKLMRARTSTKTTRRGSEATLSDADLVEQPNHHPNFGGRPVSPASSMQPRPTRRQIPPLRPLLGNVNPDDTKARQVAQGSVSRTNSNAASSGSAAAKNLEPPLRRSTRQSTGEKPPPPPADLDEVILVYPQGVPGKVNITNGDVARLQPGEFLNDTLIEFGLKLWLKELEEKNPELAKQIHVFSSFFYKKLNKRNTEEGYNSVRKWTAKIDLFEKKYIIVPINEHMHWYLALIYAPEHVISSPSSPIPMSSAPAPPASAPTEFSTNPSAIDDIESEELQQMTSSEQGIEEDLTTLTQACSISASTDGKDNIELEAIDVMNVDSPTLEDKYSMPDEHIVTDGDVSHSTLSSPMRFTPELPEIIPEFKRESSASASSTNGDDADLLNIVDEDEAPPDIDIDEDAGIHPQSFYGTTRGTRSGRLYGKSGGRQSAQRPRRSQRDDDDMPQVMDQVHHPKRTYILTLDSLGSKHIQASRQLTRYLKFEAKDKKGIDSQAKIEVKQVYVPTQPNFCDCGIYLLHLAQTFISDPGFYMEKVFTTTSKTPNSVRQEFWHDAKVPVMREALTQRIHELSKEWKLLQKQKPTVNTKEQASVVEDDPSSDSDIDIIEPTVVPSKGKGKTPYKQTAAARLR